MHEKGRVKILFNDVVGGGGVSDSNILLPFKVYIVDN